MNKHSKKAVKKAVPPSYTIDSFRIRKQDINHFDMVPIKKDTREIGRSMQPHSHNCCLIIVVTHGGGIHTVDGEVFNVKPNMIFFLMPGQIHSYDLTPDIEGFAVYYTVDFYLHYARERHFDKIPFFRSMTAQTVAQADVTEMKTIEVLLHEMYSEYTQKLPAKEEALRNFLDILLIRINRLWKHDKLIRGKVTGVVQFRKFLEFLEENYKRKKKAGDYAKLLHVTPNHLNTLCRQSVKQTVTELIHDRIMLEAKRQLAYTDRGVKQIADDLGFKDYTYFLRLFKKKTGLTPDKFRSNSETAN